MFDQAQVLIAKPLDFDDDNSCFRVPRKLEQSEPPQWENTEWIFSQENDVIDEAKYIESKLFMVLSYFELYGFWDLAW